MNYTSIEQGKKLIELGLKPESADMYYQYVLPHSDKIKHNPEVGDPLKALEWYNKGYTFNGKEPLTLDEYCVPCWSVGALMDVMPKKIKEKYNLMLGRAIKRNWCVAYMTLHHQYYLETADSIIDACYNMVVWLFKNGYIKKNMLPSQAAYQHNSKKIGII